MGKFSLTETENEVMEFFWNNEGKFAFGEIYDYFTKEKNKTWKKQTVQTFITYLIQKGVLANEKKGNMYLYFLKITKDEYMQKWTKKFLDKTFDDSIKKFFIHFRRQKWLRRKNCNRIKRVFKQ